MSLDELKQFATIKVLGVGGGGGNAVVVRESGDRVQCARVRPRASVCQVLTCSEAAL